MKNLFCIGLISLSFLMCASAFAAPECVSAYGKDACGYNCTSGYGELKCTNSPYGACLAAYGDVVCYDPPRRVHEKAECISGYGEIACGYNCASGYGEVKCSSSPYGACLAAYGDVVCYNPPSRVHEKAECISGYGEIACGYNCASGYGEVKCSNSPDGICRAANGDVKCWEP